MTPTRQRTDSTVGIDTRVIRTHLAQQLADDLDDLLNETFDSSSPKMSSLSDESIVDVHTGIQVVQTHPLTHARPFHFILYEYGL